MLRHFILGLTAVTAIAAAAPEPSVDDVIAKSIEARGGLARVKAVQSLRMTGTMSMGQMDMPITVEKKRPDSLRVEMTFQGTPTVQGYDGHQAWAIPPMGERRPQALPAEAARQMAQQADIEDAIVDYKAKGNQVELVGREKLDAGDAYRVKVTHKSGDVDFYLIDAKSFLPVRVEAKRRFQGTEIDGETTLSGYKEFGGWKWPTSIENAAKGRPERQTLTFDRIEVNPALDEARFRMPAGAPSETKKP